MVQVERLIEKSPTHISMMCAMRDTFPNARFLFIHRHPITTFASYHKRLQRKTALQAGADDDHHQWLDIGPSKFAQSWIRQVNLALADAAAHSDDFRFVSYEDLTEDPEKSLGEIMDFLDESFERSLLPQDSEREWEDPLLFKAISRNQNGWEKYVTAEDAAAVERATKEQCKRLGYASKTGVF